MRAIIGMVVTVGLLVALSASASAMAVTLYASDAIGRDMYAINTLDGSVIYLGHPGVASGFCGLEYSQRGDVLLGLTRLTTAALYTIDPSTMSATRVGDLGIGYVYEGSIAFDPTDGTLYGSNYGANENPGIFVVDPNTGAATTLGLVRGAPHDFDGLVFDEDGQLYGLDGETQALWKIDKHNPGGVGTQQVGSGLGSGIDMGSVGGITAGSDGVVYAYGADSHQLFTINLATGSATVLFTFGPDVPIFYSLAGAAAVSPVESTSWGRIKSMFNN